MTVLVNGRAEWVRVTLSDGTERTVKPWSLLSIDAIGTDGMPLQVAHAECIAPAEERKAA